MEERRRRVFSICKHKTVSVFFFFIIIIIIIIIIMEERNPTSRNSFRLPTEPMSVGEICTAY
jgi:hypothetical protein